MDLKDITKICVKAWGQYADKHQIHRDDPFYLLKMQEELRELTRAFLELRGSEKTGKTSMEDLKSKLASDAASLVGNALILAHHFDVDLERAQTQVSR